MKKYIKLNNLFSEIYRKRLTIWLDKITFPKILVTWVTIIIIFGAIYFLSISDSSHLINKDGKPTLSIVDSIYFSFITATTTGFGDVIPVGYFRFIAIAEVVFGLLLLAVVTSKLVSIKQDVILNEIYELSFNEKISKLRATLILFKQNLDHLIIKAEDEKITRRDIIQLNNLYFSQLEGALHDITFMTGKTDQDFVKKIDPVRIELLLNSINTSFAKISKLAEVFNEKEVQWDKTMAVLSLRSSIRLSDRIFNNVSYSRQLTKEGYSGFENRRLQEIERLDGLFDLK